MHKIHGSVLIFVLVLSSLMSLLILGAWQLVWGGQRSLQDYHQIQNDRIVQEHIMSQAESKIYETNEQAEAVWIQFVPDTLHYGETHGVDYYLLRTKNTDAHLSLTTTQAIRR